MHTPKWARAFSRADFFGLGWGSQKEKHPRWGISISRQIPKQNLLAIAPCANQLAPKSRSLGCGLGGESVSWGVGGGWVTSSLSSIGSSPLDKIILCQIFRVAKSIPFNTNRAKPKHILKQMGVVPFPFFPIDSQSPSPIPLPGVWVVPSGLAFKSTNQGFPQEDTPIPATLPLGGKASPS